MSFYLVINFGNVGYIDNDILYVLDTNNSITRFDIKNKKLMDYNDGSEGGTEGIGTERDYILNVSKLGYDIEYSTNGFLSQSNPIKNWSFISTNNGQYTIINNSTKTKIIIKPDKGSCIYFKDLKDTENYSYLKLANIYLDKIRDDYIAVYLYDKATKYINLLPSEYNPYNAIRISDDGSVYQMTLDKENLQIVRLSYDKEIKHK